MGEMFLDNEGIPFVMVTPGRRLFRIERLDRKVEIEDRSSVVHIEANSVQITEEEAMRLVPSK